MTKVKKKKVVKSSVAKKPVSKKAPSKVKTLAKKTASKSSVKKVTKKATSKKTEKKASKKVEKTKKPLTKKKSLPKKVLSKKPLVKNIKETKAPTVKKPSEKELKKLQLDKKEIERAKKQKEADDKKLAAQKLILAKKEEKRLKEAAEAEAKRKEAEEKQFSLLVSELSALGAQLKKETDNTPSSFRNMTLPLLFSLIKDAEDQKVDLPFELLIRKKQLSEEKEENNSGFTKKDQFLDLRLMPKTKTIFANMASERVDKSRLNGQDTNYISLWTNRVAMWWGFRRILKPVMDSKQHEISDSIEYYRMQIEQNMGGKKLPLDMNPFECFGHAFPHVLEAWRFLREKLVNKFKENTPNGEGYREDFVSDSHEAFLRALEALFIDLLGSSIKAQSIPFNRRYERAIQKFIRRSIPNLGDVKVPMESKKRKEGNMITYISFDDFMNERKDQD